jgi:hypothetical protein
MNSMKRIIVGLMVMALAGVSVLAGAKSKSVTFREDVTVNGTVVKKGTYKVTFNDETGELQITDGKKLIAKARAKLAKSDSKLTSRLLVISPRWRLSRWSFQQRIRLWHRPQ